MPQQSAEAYEALRSQALHAEEHQNSNTDRVVLVRQGMAAWIKRTEGHSLTSLPKHMPVCVSSKTSSPRLVEEVVGLIAEIIIKSERFPPYA
jgi:hypothetical protein